MIKIYGVDKKLHGDELTTYLSKKGVSYTIDYSQEDYEAGLFNIYIEEYDNLKRISVGIDSLYLIISPAECPADGYDIARNEYYNLEVI